MSNGTCQWFHYWHTRRFNLTQCAFVRDGIRLNAADKATWVDTMILHGILLEDLGFARHANVETRRWLRAISKVDVIDVVTTYKEADALLLLSWEQDNISWETFKQSLSFRQAKQLLRPVWSSLMSYFKYSCSPAEFRRLHQWLAFPSRVNLRNWEDDSLIREYVDTDESLAEAKFHWCGILNNVLRSWLKDFSVSGHPRHGNGAVAEKMDKRSLLGKYRYLGSDDLLDVVCQDSGLCADDFMPFGDRFLNPYGDVIYRKARVQAVPKSALKRRTICMEPAALQYWQHMVSTELQQFIADHPVLHRHVRLEDSSFNRNAARAASYFGVDATVDLSAASDRVSWDVVCRCFAHTPLLPWLHATRSNCAELPDGTVITFRKFAPMGSALCFPVETLMFSACCEVAAIAQGKASQSNWKVYGDDIVIEAELVPQLYDILTSLGHVVNKDKSFARRDVNVFRESCGGEYVGGLDVTPVRISRQFSGGSLLDRRGHVGPGSAKKYVADIEMANAFYDHGLLGCRRWILQRVLQLPRDLQPVFGPGYGQIHSDGSCDNYGRRLRWVNWDPDWNRNRPSYQRLEIKAGVVVASCTSPPEGEYTEEIRYLEWWLAALRSPDPYDKYGVCSREPIHVGPRQDLRLVSRWVPVAGPGSEENIPKPVQAAPAPKG